MKRQGGFTLIELVVVIVILGILAVTAAPRFLNLQDDAREATLEGLAGAIQGASSIVYGKAAIAGIEGTSGAVSTGFGTTSIETVFGYPEATSSAMGAIVQGLEADGDFTFIRDVTADSIVTFGIAGYTNSCVEYRVATATTPAQVDVISPSGTDCTAE